MQTTRKLKFKKDFKILIGCEESDEVRGRFEKLGFNAWSCDIQENRNPNAQHFRCDIFEVLRNQWDVLIAFPPCTDLAVSGAAWFEEKRKDGRQQKAIDFFLAMANADVKHIAVENPVGIMSKIYRKPSQIIQPYFFGDSAQKTTCLWLKNLPLLYHNSSPNLFDNNVTHVDKGQFLEWTEKKTGKIKRQPFWYATAKMNGRGKIRSKTFPGIADAMANQWSKYFIEKYSLK